MPRRLTEQETCPARLAVGRNRRTSHGWGRATQQAPGQQPWFKTPVGNLGPIEVHVRYIQRVKCRLLVRTKLPAGVLNDVTDKSPKSTRRNSYVETDLIDIM